jgi:hypothetical protein
MDIQSPICLNVNDSYVMYAPLTHTLLRLTCTVVRHLVIIIVELLVQQRSSLNALPYFRVLRYTSATTQHADLSILL